MKGNSPYLIILYVVEGEGMYDLGYTKVWVMKGELYILPLADPCVSKLIDTNRKPPIRVIHCAYSAESLGMAAPLLPMKWMIFLQYQTEFIKLLEIMSSYQQKLTDVSSRCLDPLWSSFIAFLLFHPRKASLQVFEEDSVPIRQALHFMGCRFMSKLSIAEISRLVVMSTRHFQRMFTVLNGRSFVQMLQEIRIRHSCGLLQFTSLSVQSIAENVGIYDMNYFYQLFRNYCGMTPAAFRLFYQRTNTNKNGAIPYSVRSSVLLDLKE